MHARTIVREALAKELINRGAWRDAVFVTRPTAISEDEIFPNICIYTLSEQSVEKTNNYAARMSMALRVELRVKRENMLKPWARIEGMPNHPAQAHNADRLLDDCCAIIEQIVFCLFQNKRVEYEADGLANVLDVEEIAGFSTDISHSADGNVPYLLAEMEFTLIYQDCYDCEIPTDPLQVLLGEIWAGDCKDKAGIKSINIEEGG